MTSKLIVPALRALLVPGRPLGRMRTTDAAFTFRAGAGFPGDVNRGHPSSIQPCLADPTTPPTLAGQAVVIASASQGVRPLVAGDSALTTIWGVVTRDFPIQQSTSSSSYAGVALGAAAVPAAQPVGVLTAGYIMVAVVGTPVKGGAVFVWIAVASGNHVQSGFEAASGGGSTIALDERYTWNSGPDSAGVAELKITV